MTRDINVGNVAKPKKDDLEVSVSIELDDADLLDIDGSDDATMMFASSNRSNRSKRAKAKKGRAAKKEPTAPQVVKVRAVDLEDLRATNPIERQAEIYTDAATAAVDGHPTLIFDEAAGQPTLIFNEPSVIVTSSPSIASVQPTVRKPQAPAHFWRPTHFWRPPEREVSESYPPVAMITGKQAAVKLGTGSSRWRWGAAAVIATLLIIGGSLRSAPHVAAASGDTSEATGFPPPPTVVILEAPKAAAPTTDDANKVVKFDDGDAVAVKRTAPKAPVAFAAPRHAWTPPPAKKVEKPAPLATDKKADDKKADPAAHKKTAEEKELEDLQLRAAER